MEEPGWPSIMWIFLHDGTRFNIRILKAHTSKLSCTCSQVVRLTKNKKWVMYDSWCKEFDYPHGNSDPINSTRFNVSIPHHAFQEGRQGVFTRGPKSQVTWGQSMQSQMLRAWKWGLTSSHGVPCLKSQGWRWGSGLMLRVESSKKLAPILNTSAVNIFA